MEETATNRGFALFYFNDIYGASCSIQESSMASPPAIWLGVTDANPKIMASLAAANGVETSETTGWVPYQLSDDVLLTTRMHLNQQQAADLIPLLQHFVNTGNLIGGE